MRTWSLPVSLSLHALLLLGFGWFLTSKRPAPPLAEGMPVEIWTPEQLLGSRDEGERQPPSAGPGVAARTDEATGPVEARSSDQAMTRAETMRSGEVLSHPLSRGMAAALDSMDEETRWEQLCAIEAMAQIAASFRDYQPDRVVAYAMADVKVAKGEIVAEGAAFRSRGRWYHLQFLCRLNPDRQAVEAFEFSVGDAIPRRLWDAHNLPPRY